MAVSISDRQAEGPPARPYPFGTPDRLELDPMYGFLRENEPLALVQLPYGGPAWLATRYDDVRLVLGDLRFSRTPTSVLARYATEDVQLSGGLVRAGEPVLPAYYAANRDPRVFADPDRLDLTRVPLPHFAFGFGTHFCTGAQLGRMELQVALAALLDRCPGLRLASPADDIEWKTGMVIRGPVALPVAW
jgi:cytochrome P450